MTDIRKTRVKICGITAVEDGLTAAELGADALGFVFAPSKRRISPQTARGIIKELPPFVTTVGVFVNETVEKVQDIADFSGIDVIQLHGAESPEYCAKLKKRVIKRIDVLDVDTTETLVSKMRLYKVAAYLLDPGAGSGKVFHWEKAKGIDLPLIIAGGLTPGNVKNVVRLLNPYGVDVSSGVEKSPGIKDKDKVRIFIAEVK